MIDWGILKSALGDTFSGIQEHGLRGNLERSVSEANIPSELRGGANKLDQRKQKFPREPQTNDIYYDKSQGKLYQYNGGDANDINSYTDVTEQYR